MSRVGVVAIVGAGQIGAGWAALFAAHGARVRIADPDPAALERALAELDVARAVLRAAHATRAGAEDQAPGTIERASSPAEAAEGAEWIQESLPERLSLKREVLATLAGRVRDDAVVASSTSSLAASAIGAGLPFERRLLVAHPLHPVYAVPVVELSAGRGTSADALRRADEVLRYLRREPVLLRRETPGLVANRLTAALLREAVALVAEGVVDARDLDRIVARGVATGWTVSGVFATESAGAGGDAGAWMARFGGALEALLGALASWSTLDDAHRAALARALGECRASLDARAWAESVARAAGQELSRATQAAVSASSSRDSPSV